jgi:hypothetical protein
MRRLVALSACLLAAYTVALVLPDVKRYLKIVSM